MGAPPDNATLNTTPNTALTATDADKENQQDGNRHPAPPALTAECAAIGRGPRGDSVAGGVDNGATVVS